jgi:hypothetical protein
MQLSSANTTNIHEVPPFESHWMNSKDATIRKILVQIRTVLLFNIHTRQTRLQFKSNFNEYHTTRPILVISSHTLLESSWRQ